MNNDIKTLRAKAERRTFLNHVEMKRIRVDILRCSQIALASQLLNPTTGQPVSTTSVSRWEKGIRPIPLWVARHVRLLQDAARKYDLEV